MNNTIFDTTPFAYVGNNKNYEELSKEELEELKKNKKSDSAESSDTLCKKELDESISDPVDKEALPTSDEVEESSASVIGPMLPQVGLTTEEPSVDNIIADVNEDAELLKEAIDDTVNGSDMYFEKAGFIEALKKKFHCNDDKAGEVDIKKLMNVAKAYSDLQMEKSRMKIMVAKNQNNKDTAAYKDLQKKYVSAEKKFRACKKTLSKDELLTLEDYISGFNSEFRDKVKACIEDVKDAKKASLKQEFVEYAEDSDLFDILMESVNDEFYFEGVNWDIHKKYREDLKTARKKIIETTKLLKKHEYSEARDVLNTAIKTIQMCKINMMKNIEKIDDGKVITAICGFFLRNVTVVCRDIIFMMLCAPIATVRAFIDGVKDLSNLSKKYQDKGYFVAGDFNTYVNFVEKDYDRILHFLKSFLSKIDEIEKKHEEKEAKKMEVAKESVETEGCCSKVVTEKNIDPDMKPLIEKLHDKGYKTRASSSGHKNVIIKKDGDADNIADNHHYGDARLVFDQKYNLGTAPKYWYWKKVDDDIDYLDIMQISKDECPDNEDKFNNWKKKYMESLTNWVDSLPNVSDTNKTEVEEACHKESTEDINEQIDTLFESVMNDLEIDVFGI